MTSLPNYPERCIKGIPSTEYLDSQFGETIVGAHLFQFQDRGNRTDGWLEESVNWEDDDTVIDRTLRQEKAPGQKQFKGGVAIIARRDLDQMKMSGRFATVLDYERQPVADNPYHGNLLLATRTANIRRKLSAAQLALCVSKILPQR